MSLKEIMEQDRKAPVPYPTTQMVCGEITAEEVIEKSADLLYDQWCCDRRWKPADVARLMIIGCERRGEEPGFLITEYCDHAVAHRNRQGQA
jgi:hypothetical protein